MFPVDRQARLDPILERLFVEGVVRVEQDDFDSSSINVFCWLASRVGGSVMPGRCALAVPLRRVLNALRRVEGVRVLGQPRLCYVNKVRDGYDSNVIKLEVSV